MKHTTSIFGLAGKRRLLASGGPSAVKVAHPNSGIAVVDSGHVRQIGPEHAGDAPASEAPHVTIGEEVSVSPPAEGQHTNMDIREFTMGGVHLGRALTPFVMDAIRKTGIPLYVPAGSEGRFSTDDLYVHLPRALK